MWILALETASQHGSAALLRDCTCVASRALEVRSYAARLVPALQDLLHEHALELAQVDLIAAANGPGSFTGVRIGLATVKALMEAAGVPALAVGTLAAVAASAQAPVLAALDAGRGEVYWGAYPGAAEGVESAAEFSQRLAAWPGAAATPDAALAAAHARLRAIDPLLAPAVGRLGWTAWRENGGVGASVLSLDARYLGQRWQP
ncbi:MAG: tRNA (adenosine(37)-N6)-threonylcarbamoyltransferase complex dimerization subunit type 1 TsaB [Terriglobales bacterium]